MSVAMRLFKSLLFAAIASALAWPASAAITITQINGGANGSSSTLSTPATTVDCPIGSLILVLATSTATTLSSVADTAGNTYTAPFDAQAGTGINLAWSFANNTTHDLPIGGGITGTFSGTGPNSIQTACLGGIATSTPIDVQGQTAQGVAATSATTVNSGVLSQASEIVLGSVGGAVAVGTVTCGTGWTIQAGGVSNTPSARICFQIVASTSSVAFSPTWGNPSNYVTDLFSLKAPGGGASTTPAGLTLMGVGP